MNKSINGEIEKYLEKYPPALKVYRELIRIGDVYIMGGLLREYKDNNRIEELRDADFTVYIKKQEKWDQLLAEIPNRVNRFGGHKFKCSGFIIDVWDVKETWALKNKIIEVEENEIFEYLPRSVFLNVDALVYDLSNDKWNDEIYRQAMLERKIDVVLENNPFIELNLLRAMILKRKYKMQYSEKLASLICEHYCSKQDFARELLETQSKRYGYSVLTQTDINHEIDICKNIEKQC